MGLMVPLSQTLVPLGSFLPATQLHVAKADEEKFKGNFSAIWLVCVLFTCLLFVAIIRLPLYLSNRRALRDCVLLAQQLQPKSADPCGGPLTLG